MKYIFCILIFTNLLVHAQTKEIIKFVKNDTIIKYDTAELIRVFCLGRDTIKIKGFYRFNKVDFSFLYPELLDSVQINFNNRLVGNSFVNPPFFNDYSLYYDYNKFYKFKKEENYLIYSTPLFCNGFNCSLLSVLVLKIIDKKIITCYEINTNFKNIRKLDNTIDKYFKKNKKIKIPQ